MELTNYTANTISMYLSDSVTNTGNTYFLFKIYDSHKTPIYFTAANQSSVPASYDLFTFILTGSSSVNLTGGTIYIQDGTYNLDVYQMSAYSSSSSQIIGDAIHYDVVKISSANYQNASYIYSGGSKTIYMYSPHQ